MQNTRECFIIAGPNGSGKTTSAMVLLPDVCSCVEYVNADSIASGISPFNPDSVAIQSGKIMLSRIKDLISERISFAFETTLSSRMFANLIKYSLNTNQYRINLLYLWLESPELAIKRVYERVLSGGHDIPIDVIRRRYHRSIENFLSLYSDIVDS
jgi:predicted ABC-type ATPase